MELTDKHRRYWRKNLNITAILLAIWFVVTFVVSYFARDLSFNFFGWPFSFWMAAQGSILIFLAVVALYAWLMNRWEAQALGDAGPLPHIDRAKGGDNGGGAGGIGSATCRQRFQYAWAICTSPST